MSKLATEVVSLPPQNQFGRPDEDLPRYDAVQNQYQSMYEPSENGPSSSFNPSNQTCQYQEEDLDKGMQQTMNNGTLAEVLPINAYILNKGFPLSFPPSLKSHGLTSSEYQDFMFSINELCEKSFGHGSSALCDFWLVQTLSMGGAHFWKDREDQKILSKIRTINLWVSDVNVFLILETKEEKTIAAAERQEDVVDLVVET
eukprot:Awhi_evm1s3975